MTEATPPNCTYRPGDVTCFNNTCPRVCVRNYRDQSAGDLAVATLGGRGQRGRHSRRHREPRLIRWLASLKS